MTVKQAREKWSAVKWNRLARSGMPSSRPRHTSTTPPHSHITHRTTPHRYHTSLHHTNPHHYIITPRHIPHQPIQYHHTTS
ncbi:hypothetical protein E2C01_101896 [Portunus trituberculatus]|uniref:Uncharacterized protein n=1 Tax=Portunus trituberculatus TaxID=210409 RepID=A0A5B7KH54_PORTR|nr:hypothetical protein [Portunus trituberculatus]